MVFQSSLQMWSICREDKWHLDLLKLNIYIKHINLFDFWKKTHTKKKLPFLFYFLQEEELRKSGEAKYAHLSNDLHVLIEVFAPPGEAYSRMSHALEEIKKFLVPVSLILYIVFLCNFYSYAVLYSTNKRIYCWLDHFFITLISMQQYWVYSIGGLFK